MLAVLVTWRIRCTPNAILDSHKGVSHIIADLLAHQCCNVPKSHHSIVPSYPMRRKLTPSPTTRSGCEASLPRLRRLSSAFGFADNIVSSTHSIAM